MQQGVFQEQLQNSEEPLPLNRQRQDLSRAHLTQEQGDGKSSGKTFSFDTTICWYKSSFKLAGTFVPIGSPRVNDADADGLVGSSGGVESVVFRCKKIEGALNSNFSSSAVEKVQINPSGFNSDIHASAEYRANLIKVFAKKAVEACS